jgi:hypothetical protein
MITEQIHITYSQHRIPVPYGMSIAQAWERIRLANQEGRPAWSRDVILRGWCTIMTTPAGRLVAIHR